MKILVRNLARATTEENLSALFAPYGSVQSCDLVMDKESGASKGFGFIEMPKSGEAKAAIKALNNRAVDGMKIRVKLAQAKTVAPQTPS
ncbi:MAG: RNA-binding protein [Robiginitomaculum sp.]|nr:RNA-binding protein [Robiginitomaculum sp.]